jgi:hypothetical protein
MPATPARTPSSRFVLVVFLTFALVFAYWQGLAHRIAHASQFYAAPVDVVGQEIAGSHQKAIHHSCLAFDAATVSPTVCSPHHSAAILPGTDVLALLVAFASWVAPFEPHFSSRAPPRA